MKIKNMKNFVKSFIKWSIVGFVIGFIIVKFVAPVLNLEGDLGIVISAVIGAIGTMTIIEISKSSKEKQSQQEKRS